MLAEPLWRTDVKLLTPAQRLDQIHRPKEVLDLRGLLMHSYHGSHDSDAFLGSDGHTLIKRAAHGIEAFIERYLHQIFARTAPIDVIAVLEGGNDLRAALYPTYKAKRKAEKDAQDPKLTEELKKLQDGAVRLLSYLGCTIIEVPKVEADDVIGMICHRWPGPVVVHTRDVDLAQLAVLPNTTVFLAEQVVEDFVVEKHSDKTEFNLKTKHIALFKSLCGDKSDEYGGVPGIGTKAWVYLEDTYGDEGLAQIEKCVIDGDPQPVIDVVQQYGDKVLAKAVENFDQWRLCYRLATLHPNWCWMARAGKLIRPQYTKRLPLAHKLREVLESLHLGGLFDDLKQWACTESLVDESNLNDALLAKIKAQIGDSPVVGFDIEGFDKNRYESFIQANKGRDFVDQLSQELTGASFTFGRNLQHSIYIPTNHRDTRNVSQEVIGDLLTFAHQKEQKLIVAHNARFEQQLIERGMGIDLPDLEDTMTLTSYYDENLMEGASTGGALKELSSLLLRYEQTKYDDVLALANATDMRGVSGAEVLHYGCDDALTCAHLWVLMTLSVTLEGQIEFIEENDILVGKALNRSYVEGIAISEEEVALQGAADRLLVEEKTARLRELLTEHAIDVDRATAEARGRELVKSDEEFHEASIKAKNHGIGSEKILAEKQGLQYRYADAVTYKPITTRRAEVKFVPTQKGLMEVAGHLGLPDGEEFALVSVSNKQLQKWLMNLQDWMANRDDVLFEPEIEDYARLLAGCMHQMAVREGAEYTAFVDFCVNILQQHSKLITEGDELNFDSPNQCQELLYLKLGLPVRIRSKVQRGSFRDKERLPGSPATNDKAMQTAIAEDCPNGDWRREFLRTLLDVKAAATRIELYWDPYPLWRRPDTGMVHGQIKNNGTVTRRPTGSQPNLLQVSKGPVRRMVEPRYKDISIGGRYNRHVTVSIDFSGQELRITGSEAKDPSFIEAYTGGGTYVDEYGMTRQRVKDVHSVTGCMFALEVLRRELDEPLLGILEMDEFGKMSYFQFRSIVEDGVLALSQLSLSEDDAGKVVKAVNGVRKMAKAVNFLICYLGQPSTLAGNIGIPKAFAERIMAAVFASYARLAPWQAEMIALARKQGFVTTAYGNWKHVSPDILAKDGGKRSRAERQAVNQIVQGCAADILKIVLTQSERQGIFSNPHKAVMYAPVYDEVLSSVHMDYCFEYVEKMQDIMNLTPPGHAIPMMGEVSVGMNWCDQVELGDRPAERKLTELFDKWVKEAA